MPHSEQSNDRPFHQDWTQNPPETCEPNRQLEMGYDNATFLSNMEIGWVTRFVTGPNGWVEYQPRDKSNRYMVQWVPDPEMVRIILYGNVSYRRFQSILSLPLTENEYARQKRPQTDHERGDGGGAPSSRAPGVPSL